MTTPVEANSLLLKSAAGYAINNSLRFRSSASAYLNRTFGAGSQTSWTWSAWVKRGAFGAYQVLLAAPISSGSTEEYISFTSSETLAHRDGSVGTLSETTAVFRDPSAWYHVVYVYDSANATQSLRGVWYINGVQQTNSTNAIGASRASYINRALSTTIGRLATLSLYYFDGYLAEVNFIGGSSLGPTNFGEYNATTGVWQPKQYTGSYAGTNSFYLKFASFGTAAALGTDSSGNGNTWTVNNISVTAGTTYDPMLDSPTLTSATVANYPVFNPVAGLASGSSYTISNGNLQAVLSSSSTVVEVPATMSLPTTGQYYWEITVVSTNTTFSYPTAVGISNQSGIGTAATFTNNYYYYVSKTGNKYSNGSLVAYGATYTTNDIIGVAFDATAGTLTFYKNNTSQGTAYTGLTSGPYYPKVGSNDGCTVAINFGQRPFTYTPPSGYVALNAYNLPAPTITNGATVMAATTYTGTGATQNILNSNNTTTAVSFKPDMVWVKSRSAATNNNLFDSVRAATNYLISNSTAAEATNANTLTTFNSNGFSLGSDASSIGVNISTNTYVGWQWQAGQGSTSSNTAGTITSTVSVNATAGFSIVTYTGTGANATVGHGLGVAPSMIIIKQRTALPSAQNWLVGHTSLGWTNYMWLDLTSGTQTSSVVFNNTAPTSSVFSVGTGNGVNYSTATYVAYCWSAIAGYSAFGSYTGNGSSDGPFVYTGFRPRFIMIKDTTTAGLNWMITDTSRLGYNVNNYSLIPNSAGVEQGYTPLDILSNGFKIRTTDANWNSSSDNYIYAAFAENPFKYALAR